MAIYKNRVIWNQRGGSLDIDNTTEQEKIKISHRSGSNINLTNVVNSELATNNKQTNIVHDSFHTVGHDRTEFVGATNTLRTGENTYSLKGFVNQSQLDAFTNWKNTYEPIAKLNSEFKIKRGGYGYTNGNNTSLDGGRQDNPVIGFKVYTVENKFTGYSGTPERRQGVDDVTYYSTVPSRGTTTGATERSITKEDIEDSAGGSGSNAPGVTEFGANKSASSENGNWNPNTEAQKINDKILEIQDKLTPIEQNMGHGGDEILLTKRHKFEQVGVEFNDFPSIRIDEKGRSQPFEMLVSKTGTFKNHDYAPHIEEVDNSSNFPCGNDDSVVSNRFSKIVGSGGIHLKTTGNTELGGATLKAGFKQMNLNASHGVQISSESFVELQSLKSIILRTNRQVYIEGALGVRGNLIVGGGTYVEGELYCQHITAPLEVHQTQDTIVYGKFAGGLIGYAHVGGKEYPVYPVGDDNVIVTYPHSHHHNGIPMRLTESNKDVRKLASRENINTHDNIAQSLPQVHERKTATVS